MTTTTQTTPVPVRHNGFTCPKCGSHMFRTFVNLGGFYKEYQSGATIGACTENQYSLNDCQFKWNRGIAEEENIAMYQQTPEEYMTTFKLLKEDLNSKGIH
jgi:hypothetical protein